MNDEIISIIVKIGPVAVVGCRVAVRCCFSQEKKKR